MLIVYTWIVESEKESGESSEEEAESEMDDKEIDNKHTGSDDKQEDVGLEFLVKTEATSQVSLRLSLVSRLLIDPVWWVCSDTRTHPAATVHTTIILCSVCIDGHM